MDEIIYLMICTAGIYLPALDETQSEEICLQFDLQPQYVMTQEEIDGKVAQICKQARKAATDNGGHVTKCVVLDLDVEIPNISFNFKTSL